MRSTMTKRQAFAEFNEAYPPETFRARGYIDRPMRDQAWNDFTDALCKERRITSKQYASWSSPWKDRK